MYRVYIVLYVIKKSPAAEFRVFDKIIAVP